MPGPMQTLSQAVRRLWTDKVSKPGAADYARRSSCMTRQRKAPHDLDDPFFDREVQARMADVIAGAGQTEKKVAIRSRADDYWRAPRAGTAHRPWRPRCRALPPVIMVATIAPWASLKAAIFSRIMRVASVAASGPPSAILIIRSAITRWLSAAKRAASNQALIKLWY